MTGQDVIEQISQNAWTERKPGLTRMTTLLEKLDNPQKKLKFVHIGGTNGKGSVSALLSSILNRCEYRTGLFTSPHLHTFHERIQMDGAMIPDQDLGTLGAQVFQAAQTMEEDHPTEFELALAIALLYFRQEHCDVVLLEVGLGGRLDATNVIDAPELTIITSIGLDHTQQLGNSLEDIAKEKAGIIKAGSQVALYQQNPQVVEIITQTCKEKGVPLSVTKPSTIKKISHSVHGQKFSMGSAGMFQIKLMGEHQRYNAALVWEAVQLLKERGFVFPANALTAGFGRATWPGRFERVHNKPDFVLDAGHNPQGAATIVKTLEEVYPGKKVIFLVGVMNNKDYVAMMSQVYHLAKHFVTVTPNSPQGLPGEKLADYLEQHCKCGVVAAESVASGVQIALGLAEDQDVICAWGSLYIIGDIRHQLGLC